MWEFLANEPKRVRPRKTTPRPGQFSLGVMLGLITLFCVVGGLAATRCHELQAQRAAVAAFEPSEVVTYPCKLVFCGPLRLDWYGALVELLTAPDAEAAAIYEIHCRAEDLDATKLRALHFLPKLHRVAVRCENCPEELDRELHEHLNSGVRISYRISRAPRKVTADGCTRITWSPTNGRIHSDGR